MVTAPTITTERLVLRSHRLDDFELLVRLYSDDRSRFIGGPLSRQAVWQGFMSGVGQWPILGYGAWGVDLAGTGECVGQVAIGFPEEFPEPELGWLLFEGHEGHGYAYEAALRAKAFAFDEAKLETLVSYVDPENARSIRLCERLGGRKDLEAATPNGDLCLVFRYARS